MPIDRKILGNYIWKGNLNLINIVMIGLANTISENIESYELHRLLGTLLSDSLPVTKKLDIMEHEYKIKTAKNVEEEMETMCNLGQGIEDRGIEKGEAKIIINLYKKGMSLEQIAEFTDRNIENICAMIKKYAAN